MAEKLTEVKLDKGKIRVGKTTAEQAKDALKTNAKGGFSALKKEDQDALIALLLAEVEALKK